MYHSNLHEYISNIWTKQLWAEDKLGQSPLEHSSVCWWKSLNCWSSLPPSVSALPTHLQMSNLLFHTFDVLIYTAQKNQGNTWITHWLLMNEIFKMKIFLNIPGTIYASAGILHCWYEPTSKTLRCVTSCALPWKCNHTVYCDWHVQYHWVLLCTSDYFIF